MLRSPRRLLGVDVLGGERLAQDLLQVNELFVWFSVGLYYTDSVVSRYVYFFLGKCDFLVIMIDYRKQR